MPRGRLHMDTPGQGSSSDRVQPAPMFCMVQELRTVYIILNVWEKNQQDNILIHETQISASMSNVLLKYIYTLYLYIDFGHFCTTMSSCEETGWPKPEVFTTWPFMENICWPTIGY